MIKFTLAKWLSKKSQERVLKWLSSHLQNDWVTRGYDRVRFVGSIGTVLARRGLDMWHEVNTSEPTMTHEGTHGVWLVERALGSVGEWLTDLSDVYRVYIMILWKIFSASAFITLSYMFTQTKIIDQRNIHICSKYKKVSIFFILNVSAYSFYIWETDEHYLLKV
jgi:hypothetical protein